MCDHNPLRCILPPKVLHRLSASEAADVRQAAIETLQIDARFRLARAEAAGRRGGRAVQPVTFARLGGAANRIIYDQRHMRAQSPGVVARAEGQPAVADEAVNQAYDGLGATYDFYWDVFARDSIDAQ